jgi:Domain of unknown function (DUF4864)
MSFALRWLWILLLLNSSSVFAAGSSWPTTQEWAEIRQLIQTQLDAFARDDGEASYALAAPSVKERFPTAEAFNKMVRDNYRPIYNPREIKFLTPSIIQGRIMQGIQFLSDENQMLLAVFTVERQEDKTWKIKACSLMPIESKIAT